MRVPLRIYSAVLRKLAPLLMPDPSLKQRAEYDRASLPQGTNRVWFHVSSAGELESLWEVIKEAGQSKVELWLTVFSASGLASLDRLAAELRASGAQLHFAGISPREGFWRESLQHVSPALFVTVKYEAWPELWAALRERHIPLVIVGAMDRRSVRVARRLSNWFAGGVPELLMLTFREQESESLSKLFPSSRMIHTGDPRWDRIARRGKTGNPRAKALLESARGLPRPWGILGSAWIEDLKKWDRTLASFQGTLWIVPHRIEIEFLGPMERFFEKKGWRVMRSTEDWKPVLQGVLTPKAVLVDEMGFLSELYAGADWAYVGGGFSSGVHNTMEPALAGIPVAAGLRGSERFPEIRTLKECGQLTLIESAEALLEWYSRSAKSKVLIEDKNRWFAEGQARLGASERVWREIESELKRLKSRERV